MEHETVQQQPAGTRRVRFTDALGNVTEGTLVEVTDFAILIDTAIGRIPRWTGGRFDLVALGAA